MPGQSLSLEALRRVTHLDEDSLVLAPDGRLVAYATTEASGEGNRQRSLWVAETASGESWLVDDSASHPAWSPDGGALAYFGREGTDTWLRRWDGRSRESSLVTTTPMWARGREDWPQWSPCGERIFVPLHPEPDQEPAAIEAGGASSAPGTTAAVFEFPERNATLLPPPVAAEPYPTCDIGAVELASGRVDRLLTDCPVVGLRLSPDGKWLALPGIMSWPDKPAWRLASDLLVMPAAGGEPVVLAQGLRARAYWSGAPYCWSPDSSRIAFVSDGDVCTAAAGTWEVERHAIKAELSPNLLAWTPEGGSVVACEAEGVVLDRPTRLWGIAMDGSGDQAQLALPEESGGYGYPIVIGETIDSRGSSNLNGQSSVWSPKPGFCAVITQDRRTKRDEIWAVPLDGRSPERLLDRPGAIRGVRGRGEVVVFTVQDETAPAELWAARPRFERPYRLTDLNAHLRDFRMGRYRILSWRNDRGTELFGAVLLPDGHSDGDRLPVVTILYPGLTAADRVHIWNTGAGVVPPQMLVQRGYAVFILDIESPCEGVPGPSGVAPGVTAGLNELVRLGIADPGRLAVIGQSGGGAAVNRIITETSMFKAAVSVAGIGDWVSFFGQLSAMPDGTPLMYGSGLAEQAHGGAPWEVTLAYLEGSPVLHLDRITTPLLLVHGTADFQVGVEQSGQMFSGLYRLGRRVKFLRYEGEDHVIGVRPSNQAHMIDEVLAWLATYLDPVGTEAEAGR